MKTPVITALAAFACLSANAHNDNQADQPEPQVREKDYTFTAFLGSSNSECGSSFQRAGFAYDRDSDDLPAHFRLSTGPNGSCSDYGTSIDARVAKRFPIGDNGWYQTIVGGYVQKVVPFEYTGDQITTPGAKVNRGFEVRTVSASFGTGYDGGDYSVELVFNAAGGSNERYKGKYPDGHSHAKQYKFGEMSPINLAYSHKLRENIELDVLWTGVAFNDPILDAGFTYVRDNMELGLVVNYNAGALKNDAPPCYINPEINDPLPENFCEKGTSMGVSSERADNPEKLIYSLTMGWRF